MQLKVNLTGRGGHTSVNFSGEEATLQWKDTSDVEKKSLKSLIEQAVAKGFEIKSGEVASIDSGPGEIVLKGKENLLKLVAKDLIDAEIKSGKLAMEANEDGTWKILKVGDFEPKEKEQTVVSSAVPAGG